MEAYFQCNNMHMLNCFITLYRVVSTKIPWLLVQGDELKVKVNKLSSTKTQLPYSYYSLPYCQPDTIVDSAENLGEVLRGDRIENSPYVVSESDLWNFIYTLVIAVIFFICLPSHWCNLFYSLKWESRKCALLHVV